jgi:hypothetical protein
MEETYDQILDLATEVSLTWQAAAVAAALIAANILAGRMYFSLYAC